MPIVPDDDKPPDKLTAARMFFIGGIATLQSHGQFYNKEQTVKRDIAYTFTDTTEDERYTAYLSIRVRHEPDPKGAPRTLDPKE